uniref:Serpentine receptor class gamma n=1 Tax=Panagrolaimus sp. PS1159 TaxID=55785 RepID=A0AC35F587_9BILA
MVYILYDADQATLINNALVHKAIRIDSWKPWFFEHPEWDTVLWACSGYLIYFQSILHSSIAVNRSWSSMSILGNTSSKLPKIGKIMICLLPFIALAIVSPRFAGHSYYIYTVDGELTSTYKELYVQQYHAIAGPSVVLSTSCLSFFLAIGTIIRYRKLLKQYNSTMSSTMKQDLLLFIQALLMLTFEHALAAFYVVRLIGLSNKLTNLLAFAADYFDYVTDALSLCNPIALLIVCRFIRNDYLDFYFRKNNNASVAIIVSNASVRSSRIAAVF